MWAFKKYLFHGFCLFKKSKYTKTKGKFRRDHTPVAGLGAQIRSPEKVLDSFIFLFLLNVLVAKKMGKLIRLVGLLNTLVLVHKEDVTLFTMPIFSIKLDFREPHSVSSSRHLKPLTLTWFR